MKRKWLLAGMLFAMLVVVSCTTFDVKSNVEGEYHIPRLATKDYVVLGHVTVYATETQITSPFRIAKDIAGERITFDLLLQEAKSQYPDLSDIINIRVDRIDQGRTSVFDFLVGSNRTVRYIGNALVIRYTEAIEDTAPANGTTSSLPMPYDLELYLDLY